MKSHEVYEILEKYGLERILEDNNMTLVEILDLLCDLGFLELDMYLEEE
jgi:hypothetical protein